VDLPCLSIPASACLSEIFLFAFTGQPRQSLVEEKSFFFLTLHPFWKTKFALDWRLGRRAYPWVIAGFFSVGRKVLFFFWLA